MNRKIFVVISFFILVLSARADEGMWIPTLLKKYNIEDMQAKGLKLSAEDIYSVNSSSLKDAIVIFGGGCTGEVVSDQGLVFTNHHCGYGAIQYHSSVEHDYLTDGFWAMDKAEELYTPGLKVTFLVRMEEVTEQVLKGVKDKLTEEERNEIIKENIDKIKEEATAGTHYEAVVKPFFYGNQYFLFVNEIFRDIRLVGAPPSAIGKFGGDTDNWMWPRHTGDFSVFRIYASQDNKPAEYSEDNVPYQPKKHLKISMKGVNKGDFTFVFGYPGSTMQYLTSHAVSLISEISNPHKIKLREMRLDVMNAEQAKDPAVRIQYASKNARVSNAWKKWIGENKGLKRLNAIEVKKQSETDFLKWASADKKRADKYSGLITEFGELYGQLEKYTLPRDYYRESMMAIELFRFASGFEKLISNLSDENTDNDEFDSESYVERVNSFFKDYYKPIDQQIAVKMLETYAKNIVSEFHPAFLVEKAGEIEAIVNELYASSVYLDKDRLVNAINNPTKENIEQLKNDKAYAMVMQVNGIYDEKIKPEYDRINHEIQGLYRTYMAGIMEMENDKKLYPDANFTLRVAYGNVEPYYPRDGVKYKHYTTLTGIMEKDNPEIYDYDVPQKLRDLYANKDYGKYGVDGELPVCFIATNHTTGGNSGSPVLDAEGNLIGLNFDRCWEGTMSDIMFDPAMCRNITIDIRYLLFLVDKFAGATHLIEELEFAD